MAKKKETCVYYVKDVIDYFKEEGLENLEVKCAYIHAKSDDIDETLKVNWGKRKK